jgi:excisionase family DNA binding protein
MADGYGTAGNTPGGDWITIRDASQRLGVSESAIRKRLQRNTLTYYKGADGRVYLLADELLDTSDTHESHARTSSEDDDGTHGGTAMEAVLEAQKRTIEALQQQLDRAEQRDQENRRLLLAALERIPPAIDPPEDSPSATHRSLSDARVDDSKGMDSTDSAEAQNAAKTRSSWWRRIFLGE